MAEFCECGSLVIRGNCTNRKCTEHKKSLVDEASYAQIEYIKNLEKRLDEDLDIDYAILSKKEATILIDKLLERLESDG